MYVWIVKVRIVDSEANTYVNVVAEEVFAAVDGAVEHVLETSENGRKTVLEVISAVRDQLVHRVEV